LNPGIRGARLRIRIDNWQGNGGGRGHAPGFADLLPLLAREIRPMLRFGGATSFGGQSLGMAFQDLEFTGMHPFGVGLAPEQLVHGTDAAVAGGEDLGRMSQGHAAQGDPLCRGRINEMEAAGPWFGLSSDKGEALLAS